MKLELTIDQVNLILNALGNAPYIQVVALINDIKQQGEAQLASVSPTQLSPEVLEETNT